MTSLNGKYKLLKKKLARKYHSQKEVGRLACNLKRNRTLINYHNGDHS